MPAFGEVNTPADQIIWRELCRKEREVASKVPNATFTLRNAISRDEVPSKFKPCHLNPAGEDGHSLKGFDPKTIGWDEKDKLTHEFRRCRKKALAPPADRILCPETSAQEQGWLFAVKQRKDKKLKKSSTEPQLKVNDSATMDKSSKNGLTKRDAQEKEEGASQVSGVRKQGLGSWASASHLSSAPPSQLSRSSMRKELMDALRMDSDAQSGLGAHDSSSRLSAALPSELCPSVTQASNVGRSELSMVSSVPGVDKEVVRRVRAGEASVESALNEVRRYLCYGEHGNKYFRPNGETDATAYANKFVKATCGVPPHKWDPRALPSLDKKD